MPPKPKKKVSFAPGTKEHNGRHQQAATTNSSSRKPQLPLQKNAPSSGRKAPKLPLPKNAPSSSRKAPRLPLQRVFTVPAPGFTHQVSREPPRNNSARRAEEEALRQRRMQNMYDEYTLYLATLDPPMRNWALPANLYFSMPPRVRRLYPQNPSPSKEPYVPTVHTGTHKNYTTALKAAMRGRKRGRNS